MKNPDYYARQQFQKFIYRLNQPFLRIDQSAFTNVSIFDRPYLESLFGGVEFPDGQLAIDHKTTWFYQDEFHLMLKDEQTAAYSVEVSANRNYPFNFG